MVHVNVMLARGTSSVLGQSLAIAGVSAALHIALDVLITYGPWRAKALQLLRSKAGPKGATPEQCWQGIATRAVAAIHHLSVLPLCLWYVLQKPFWAQPFLYSEPGSRAVVAVTCGHFIYDLIATIRDVQVDGPVFVFHGTVALALTGSSVLNGNVWNFWVLSFFLWEGSTLFVQLRFVLAALGLRHSTLYAANGLALVASFFVCRIVWTAFMSVYFWKCTAEAMAGRMDPGTSVWVIYLGRSSLVALGSLNVYWFSKMLGYLVKMLVGPKPAPKPALEVVAKASELAEETPLLQEMSRTGKAGADTTNGGNGGVNGEGLRKRGAAGAGAAPADAPL